MNEPNLPFQNDPSIGFVLSPPLSFTGKAFFVRINYSISWIINFYLLFEVQANISFVKKSQDWKWRDGRLPRNLLCVQLVTSVKMFACYAAASVENKNRFLSVKRFKFVTKLAYLLLLLIF